MKHIFINVLRHKFKNKIKIIKLQKQRQNHKSYKRHKNMYCNKIRNARIELIWIFD